MVHCQKIPGERKWVTNAKLVLVLVVDVVVRVVYARVVPGTVVITIVGI